MSSYPALLLLSLALLALHSLSLWLVSEMSLLLWIMLCENAQKLAEWWRDRYGDAGGLLIIGIVAAGVALMWWVLNGR